MFAEELARVCWSGDSEDHRGLDGAIKVPLPSLFSSVMRGRGAACPKNLTCELRVVIRWPPSESESLAKLLVYSIVLVTGPPKLCQTVTVTGAQADRPKFRVTQPRCH
jgi:hypothetical protein